MHSSCWHIILHPLLLFFTFWREASIVDSNYGHLRLFYFLQKNIFIGLHKRLRYNTEYNFWMNKLDKLTLSKFYRLLNFFSLINSFLHDHFLLVNILVWKKIKSLIFSTCRQKSTQIGKITFKFAVLYHLW